MHTKKIKNTEVLMEMSHWENGILEEQYVFYRHSI